MLKTLIILSSFLFCISCTKQKNFNSVEWKNWTETEMNPNTRWLMSNDLLETYDLKKYSKDKIFDLLGKPTVENKNEYRYFLGTTGNGISIGTLVLSFKNDTIIKVEIIEG